MKKRPCRYCGYEGFWLQVPERDRLRWRLFSADPVPFDKCRVKAVALSRSRGWLLAETANPTPAEVFPVHRCPQYLDELVFDSLGRTLGEDVELAMHARRIPQPERARAPRRLA